MTCVLMSETVNLHYGLFIILFCMLNLEGVGAKTPFGAHFSYKGRTFRCETRVQI